MYELMDLCCFREHGGCSDSERKFCFKLVEQVFRLWGAVRDNGLLITDVLADTESDPFFRACLRDFADVDGETEAIRAEKLRRIYARYIAAGKYQGRELLCALIVAEGLSLLAVCAQESYMTWGRRLSWAIRGWFGADDRDRVAELLETEIQREEQKRRSKASLVPEFDQLVTREQDAHRRIGLRNWVRENVSSRTLALALKGAAVAVEDFFLEGLDQERLDECRLVRSCPARQMDIEAAQREMIEQANSWSAERED